MLVQIADVVDEHLARCVPPDELHHSGIPESSLLVDELAHVDQPRAHCGDETAPVEQAVSLAEEAQAARALIDIRDRRRGGDEGYPGIGRVGDVPQARRSA